MSRSEDESRKTVEVPPALAARLIHGEIDLAEFVGLNRERLYAIARAGYQLLNSGKIAEAQEIYRGLVAAAPYDSVFHCHLAATHHRLGNFEEALSHYTASLQYNIANVEALAGRSELYLQNGRLAEALADLRKAIELDPHGRKATTRRARAILLALKNALDQPPDPATNNAP